MNSKSLVSHLILQKISLCDRDVWMVPSPSGFRTSALNIVRDSDVAGEQRGRGMLIPWKKKTYKENRWLLRVRLEITPFLPQV